MIQLHRLEGFYWVARCEGFARAARAFPYPITQPAIHQQVKKLEGELGLTLFERVSKDRMLPTPAGKALFEFVQPFFEGLPTLVRRIRDGETGGELVILASSLVLRRIMPSWLARIRKRLPDVRIHLRELVSGELDGLRRGEVDLVIDHLPEVPDDLASLEIARARPFLVLPRDHPQAGKERPRLSSLKDEAFVSYPPGSLLQRLQMDGLARFGGTPRETLSASSAEVILGFVEAGLGYSLLPSLDERGPRAKGIKAIAVGTQRDRYPIYALWRKSTPEHATLDVALEEAQ